jgi:hypothetical protein
VTACAGSDLSLKAPSPEFYGGGGGVLNLDRWSEIFEV